MAGAAAAVVPKPATKVKGRAGSGLPARLQIRVLVWVRRFAQAGFLALFLFFLPKAGLGYFGLKAAEPIFALYVMLVNLPFGITIALVSRAIIGKTP